MYRASEPQEISHIHELKEHLEQRKNEGSKLDKQINRCKEELKKLMDDRENWRYGIGIYCYFIVVYCYYLIVKLLLTIVVVSYSFAYTSYHDLRNISEFGDNTLLIIKAPSDTIMECDKDNDEEVSCIHVVPSTLFPIAYNHIVTTIM